MATIHLSRIRVLAGVAAFCTAATVGGLVAANAATDRDDLPSTKFGIATGVTTDGRTYGSELDSLHGKPVPDLVAVIGDHGKAGYVDEKKLSALGDGSNSADRAKASELKARGELSLPVYSEDGVTQIDTFTSGPRSGFTVKYNGSDDTPLK